MSKADLIAKLQLLCDAQNELRRLELLNLKATNRVLRRIARRTRRHATRL